MKAQAIATRLPPPQGSPAELMQVLEAARRFAACRARAAALAERGATTAPSLAEAIERDFLAFDLGRTERALREAVLAVDPPPMLEEQRDTDDAAAGLHRTCA